MTDKLFNQLKLQEEEIQYVVKPATSRRQSVKQIQVDQSSKDKAKKQEDEVFSEELFMKALEDAKLE